MTQWVELKIKGLLPTRDSAPLGLMMAHTSIETLCRVCYHGFLYRGAYAKVTDVTRDDS